MAAATIHVCTSPPEEGTTDTQLAPPPRCGSLTLIGWRLMPAPVDSGVPDVIADVLSRALTSVFRVTFPLGAGRGDMPDRWMPHGVSFSRALAPPDWPSRIRATLRREPRVVALMSTRDAQSARPLFDMAEYPWWNQAMPILLSAPASPPPDIDRPLFFDLLRDPHGAQWPDHCGRLAPIGVLAVLRSGVDGDLCGLFTPSHRERAPFLAALEHETRDAGLGWASLDFAAFMEHL